MLNLVIGFVSANYIWHLLLNLVRVGFEIIARAEA